MVFTDDYGSLNPLGLLAAGLGVLLVGTVLIGGCANMTNNWKCSEGERVGMINKVSRKGAIWETYEGQMALEGITSDGNSAGANIWDFAIDNYWPREKQDQLADKLREAMGARQEVKIHYVEMVSTFPWRSGSDHLIQSVTPLGVRSATPKTETNSRYEPESKEGAGSMEVNLDGREYLLRHDASGKLRVTEMKEVQ